MSAAGSSFLNPLEGIFEAELDLVRTDLVENLELDLLRQGGVEWAGGNLSFESPTDQSRINPVQTDPIVLQKHPRGDSKKKLPDTLDCS